MFRPQKLWNSKTSYRFKISIEQEKAIVQCTQTHFNLIGETLYNNVKYRSDWYTSSYYSTVFGVLM